MPVRTTCPHCNVTLTFLDAHAGEQLTCPQCSGSWVYAAPEDRTNGAGRSQTVSREPTYKIACPKCAAVTKLPQAAGGHVMTCKRCAAQVVLPNATAVRKPVTGSGVEAACPRCSHCFPIDSTGEFEWTACPGCGVVSIARPKAAARTQPLPPPLPASAAASAPPVADPLPLGEEPLPSTSGYQRPRVRGQSRRRALWVGGAFVLLACVSVAVLVGVRLRDSGQANPWNGLQRIEAKAITGRELITFLKEQGVVQNHINILANDPVMREIPARHGWFLITNTKVAGRRGGVFLFEFEEGIDAKVAPLSGCEIGRLRFVYSDEYGPLGYLAVLESLASPDASTRFALPDATATRLRREYTRTSESIRQREADLIAADKAIGEEMEKLKREMEKRMREDNMRK